MTLKSQNKNCKKANDLIKIICLQRPINFSGKSNFGKNTLNHVKTFNKVSWKYFNFHGKLEKSRAI